MIKNTASKTRKLLLGSILAFTFIATLSSAKAFAGFTDCTPNQVEYMQNQLLVQCIVGGVGTNFIAQIAPPSSCSNLAVNVDTVKMWLSEAQAGVLAQKKMRFYTNTCAANGAQLLAAMDINN